jgi:hypothetical protein
LLNAFLSSVSFLSLSVSVSSSSRTAVVLLSAAACPRLSPPRWPSLSADLGALFLLPTDPSGDAGVSPVV